MPPGQGAAHVGANGRLLAGRPVLTLGDPWLAIDMATPPAHRARELRREWEQFVTGGPVKGVRAPVVDSWQRSVAAGVDPVGGGPAPAAVDRDEARALWGVYPLADAAPVVLDFLAGVADASEHMIVVSDAAGVLLWLAGDAKVRSRAADSMNFTEGAIWSETTTGTNAVGTALAADHAVQIFAAEHFNELAQVWTCSAAPVHDPDTGELLGAINLSSRFENVHPHSLAAAVATAQAVETHLRYRSREHDDRLRSRYHERVVVGGDRRALVSQSGRLLEEYPEGWLRGTRLKLPPGGGELTLPGGGRAFAEPVGHEEAFVVRAARRSPSVRPRPLLKLRLLGRDRAEVEVDGRAVVLTHRQTEILAVLSAHRLGMSSEQLAADLYGDRGEPAAARVQMHRLRKLLGRWIDTHPYRLATDVDSDVAALKGLLARGEVRQAVERYEGPLLPNSEAPGVVREREDVDRWVRQAVMTGDDDAALWAWVQSASGANDLPAWKRLLAGLEFRDPRRSLAAARVLSLRAAYDVR